MVMKKNGILTTCRNGHHPERADEGPDVAAFSRKEPSEDEIELIFIRKPHYATVA